MGDRLDQADGYPAGVSNSHPHFHGGDEPPCVCDHMSDEHECDGPCDVEGCDCIAYEPLEDDRA